MDFKGIGLNSRNKTKKKCAIYYNYILHTLALPPACFDLSWSSSFSERH